MWIDSPRLRTIRNRKRGFKERSYQHKHWSNEERKEIRRIRQEQRDKDRQKRLDRQRLRQEQCKKDKEKRDAYQKALRVERARHKKLEALRQAHLRKKKEEMRRLTLKQKEEEKRRQVMLLQRKKAKLAAQERKKRAKEKAENTPHKRWVSIFLKKNRKDTFEESEEERIQRTLITHQKYLFIKTANIENLKKTETKRKGLAP